MKTIALVAGLVFSSAFGHGQDDSNPLITRGTFNIKGNQTTFVIEFQNKSKFSIEGMKIRQVGLAIHNKVFRPELLVPTIPPGKGYTMTVNLKGAIYGVDPDEPIRVEGFFRHGRQRHYLLFSRPADCWPKAGGG